MKKAGKHSEETIQRMKANAEAARTRLTRLNEEYRVRQQARKLPPKVSLKGETFREAILRIAKEDQVAL
ncbi:MAG: hypothetical protein JOZ10_02160 [Acidobacteria bacterium]|nr:hypothetical protein [Acidobacteriota bacterium]MBV9144835.1 hypothetical protein [Acidobacteriota bacterium]